MNKHQPSTPYNVVLFGASGLTGSALINQLIDHPMIGYIVMMVRRPLPIKHHKIEQVVTDFQNQAVIKTALKGCNIAYCCLGTTIKVAGSKDAFKAVDHTLVTQLAKHCKAMDVEQFHVISSIGANANSSSFYLQVKGAMEQSLSDQRFSQLIIYRPSLLLGERKQWRIAEGLGGYLSRLLSFLFIGPLRQYKPISASQVASAMLDNSLRLMSKPQSKQHKTCRANSKQTAQITVFDNRQLHQISHDTV
ncbi:NAD(P)H-binding protein [Thalassotalea maritima]|uniref:NAD(P)H-binding protein n=1 Tax=Thalassotalea maritima TaxID=3242416 RepID=UPI003527C050